MRDFVDCRVLNMSFLPIHLHETVVINACFVPYITWTPISPSPLAFCETNHPVFSKPLLIGSLHFTQPAHGLHQYCIYTDQVLLLLRGRGEAWPILGVDANVAPGRGFPDEACVVGDQLEVRASCAL